MELQEAVGMEELIGTGWMDVTLHSPQPELWWTYDSLTDTFSPPALFVYCQVRKNRVRLVQEYFELPGLPEFGWMDATGYSPQPEVGWEYDSIADTFSPPIVNVYIRLSASKAWLLSDGIDSATITVTLLDADAQQINVNKLVKLVLRNDAGEIVDILGIQLVGGEKSFPYTSTSPGRVTVTNTDAYTLELGGTVYMVNFLTNTNHMIEIGRLF